MEEQTLFCTSHKLASHPEGHYLPGRSFSHGLSWGVWCWHPGLEVSCLHLCGCPPCPSSSRGLPRSLPWVSRSLRDMLIFFCSSQQTVILLEADIIFNISQQAVPKSLTFCLGLFSQLCARGAFQCFSFNILFSGRSKRKVSDNPPGA